MIILEEPYVSETLLTYLEKTQVPVLNNVFAGKLHARHPRLNMLTEERFIEHYHSTPKAGLYTISEYALNWVHQAFPDDKLLKQIDLLKDKTAFREKIRPMYEDLFFQQVSSSGLFDYDISKVQLPVVLKPSVGFLSTGVYTITSVADWEEALKDIKANFIARASSFPDRVVEDAYFIIESYIQGKEFAIDLYFRDKVPIIINILEHPFSSGKDVSDRLYSTNKELFDKYLGVFTKHISQLNELLELENIPVHMELRMDQDRIVPIEINPLRFAGLCLNEIHYHITGNHPLSYYYNRSVPDYDSMWKGKEQKTISFSVFEKPTGAASQELDFEKVKKLFANMIELRPVNNPNLNIKAFVFSETDTSDRSEKKAILKLDINELIKPN